MTVEDFLDKLDQDFLGHVDKDLKYELKEKWRKIFVKSMEEVKDELIEKSEKFIDEFDRRGGKTSYLLGMECLVAFLNGKGRFIGEGADYSMQVMVLKR